MRFLYPLGLLGLIGIPILIIVYIIKSKYTEQTIPSTYLWTLSEKFLKRKKRVSPLAGLISLLLQILAVATISLAIAHPVFVIEDGAHDYCFMLDASGSMNVVENGKTRFELGKDEIAKLIDESAGGSSYTLICVSNGVDVVFEGVEDKEQAMLLLGEVKSTHTEADMNEALGKAQAYFNANRSAKLYFVTDTAYTSVKNTELIRVGTRVENYAIGDVQYDLSGGTLILSGSVHSYLSDADLTVSLYVDGAKSPAAETTVTVAGGESVAFSMAYSGKLNADGTDFLGINDFSSLKLCVNGSDAQTLDNEYMIFNTRNESAYSILLVSRDPYMIEQAIRAWNYTHIDLVDPDQYTDAEGYGLYIFDSFSPKRMPRDGSVMIINPTGELSGTGFSVQSEILLDMGGTLDVSKSSSTLSQKLTAGLNLNDVWVSAYLKCGLNRNFTTVMSYRATPVVFAGTNDYGNREVVLAFDLHKSNLAVLPDYLPFMKNLLEYSFPTVLDSVNFACGEEMTVNVIPGCESIRVDSPSGEVYYLDTASAMGTVNLNEVGVWHVTLMVGGSERVYSVYTALSDAEREPNPVGESFELSGTPEKNYRDGIYDVLIIAFICLAVFVVADWMVYCYEKYQLR